MCRTDPIYEIIVERERETECWDDFVNVEQGFDKLEEVAEGQESINYIRKGLKVLKKKTILNT